MIGQLRLTALQGIPDVQPGDDVPALILNALAEPLEQGDVLVIAQKIVSKSEDRYVDLRTIEPSARARGIAREIDKDPRLVEVVLSESDQIVRSRPGLLIVAHRLGVVLANAGVDRSNVMGEERVLLWPRDPDGSAARIREALIARTGAHVGVVISDSIGRPFRNGTVGVAIGAAGLSALIDLRGTEDRYGRRLETTQVAHADELAAAASLLMGQAAEGQPVVVIRGLGPSRSIPASALVRARAEDLFR